MNPGNLDTLCELLEHAPARGAGGEVLTKEEPWKLKEQMYLGRYTYNGRALPTAQREAAQIERVYEGWARLNVVKTGMRLRVPSEGITYTIERVDPANGRQWMYVYCSVVL